jgi:hypothetical protein
VPHRSRRDSLDSDLNRGRLGWFRRNATSLPGRSRLVLHGPGFIHERPEPGLAATTWDSKPSTLRLSDSTLKLAAKTSTLPAITLWLRTIKLWLPAMTLWLPAIKLWLPAMMLWLPAIKLWLPAMMLWLPAIKLWLPAIKLWLPAMTLWLPAITLKPRPHPSVPGSNRRCSTFARFGAGLRRRGQLSSSQ